MNKKEFKQLIKESSIKKLFTEDYKAQVLDTVFELSTVPLEDLKLEDCYEGEFHYLKMEMENGKYDFVPQPVIVYYPDRKLFDVVSKYDARRFQLSDIATVVDLKDEINEHKEPYASIVKEAFKEVKEELSEK